MLGIIAVELLWVLVHMRQNLRRQKQTDVMDVQLGGTKVMDKQLDRGEIEIPDLHDHKAAALDATPTPY